MQEFVPNPDHDGHYVITFYERDRMELDDGPKVRVLSYSTRSHTANKYEQIVSAHVKACGLGAHLERNEISWTVDITPVRQSSIRCFVESDEQLAILKLAIDPETMSLISLQTVMQTKHEAKMKIIRNILSFKNRLSRVGVEPHHLRPPNA